MTVEIALLISIVSVSFSVYFGLKNSKKADSKDIETRVEQDTRVNVKLDDIKDSLGAIKDDVTTIKQEVQRHNDRIIKVEESTKSAHKRLDEMQRVLNDYITKP